MHSGRKTISIYKTVEENYRWPKHFVNNCLLSRGIIITPEYLYTKQTECPSRLGILKCQWSIIVETASKHFSEHNHTLWTSNSRPLCIQTVLSTSTMCSMRAQSKQHSKRCSATVLEQNVSIWFPTFQLDKSNSEKNPPRKGRANDDSVTTMGNTTWVSFFRRDVDAMRADVDTTARFTVRSSRKQTTFSSKLETNVSGL